MRREILLAAGILLSGCASSSTVISTTPGPKATGSGVSYYLPKQLVRLTATRAELPNVGKLRRQLAEAEAAESEAKKLVALKTGEVTRLDKILAQLPAGHPKRPDFEAAAAEAKAALIMAQEAQGAAQAAIAKLKDAYEAVLAQHKYENSLAFFVLPAVPDTAFRFVAEVPEDSFRDIDVTLTTTPEGFLSTGNATTTDRRGDIAVEVVKMFANAAKIASGGSSGVLTKLEKRQGREGCNKAFTIDLYFDPVESLNQVNTNLIDLCFHMQVEVSSSFSTAVKPEVTTSAAGPMNGLVYRRARPLLLKVMPTAGGVELDGVTAPSKTIVIQVPNGAPLDVVSYDTANFVTNSDKVSFVNGMLTSMESKRPSEALGLVMVPSNVLREVVSIPTELVQFRINHDTALTKEAQGQKALTDAERSLLEARRLLEQAQQAEQPPAN